MVLPSIDRPKVRGRSIRQHGCRIALGCIAVFSAAAFDGGAAMLPRALTCEYRTDPLVLDETRPRLSWTLESPERGQKQNAYQILVASTPEKLQADEGDLWDSGKVVSDRSVQVEYAGRPLRSRMHCHWKVRAWDRDDEVSPWSPAAHWSMGLLRPLDWQAEWIAFDTRPPDRGAGSDLPPCPYLRKSFTAPGPVRRATLYVSALGLFEISINGHRVGEDWFTPGWSNYHRRVYYLTYDVTDLVRPGSNALGAILANGWYAGYVGFAPRPGHQRRAFYGQVPALIAQLEIEDGAGSTATIFSDGSWKASTGPIRESDILMGETHDARREIPDWDRPGFDDSTWTPVTRRGDVTAVLQAYPADPVRRIEELRPVETMARGRGVYIFDMGQNFAGRVRLRVRGRRGDRITIRHAEMLQADGSLMTANLRDARCTDTYVLKGGEAIEEWEPRFTYHGFQYVEVSGLGRAPGADTLTGIVMHSDLPRTGTFQCSHELVNRLVRNIVWSQRSNFFEIPTDCPQRDERLGWTGDAQIFARSATYNMDIGAFFSKWLTAVADDQHPSGAFPDFAPRPFLQFEPSPGWMDAGVICPYTLYRVYGDTRVIRRHYGAMKRFMDHLEATGSGFRRFPRGNFWGDWQSLETRTPADLIATAYYAYDARLMAEMAAAIGAHSDAKRYAELYRRIREAFCWAYVAGDGRIGNDTQTGYALALDLGLLPAELAALSAGRLVERIRLGGGRLATGFLGTKALLPALSARGHDHVAYRLLTENGYPSWGYSIANGATTVWERWDGYTRRRGFENPEMNSFNHYAFGSVCEWIFSTMAGIDTQGPGYKHIRIRPRVGDGTVTHVRAGYRSIRGPIESEWRREDGRLTLRVAIPANTTASVHLPAGALETIREGGQALAQAEGVALAGFDGRTALLTVGSGRYHFESRFGPAGTEAE